MKKKYIILTVMILALLLCACGKKETASNTDTREQQTENETQSETPEPEVEVETEPQITIVETVAFLDDYTDGTKTVYSNGLADYEVKAKIPYWNANIHYKITDLPANGVVVGLNTVSIITLANPEEDSDAIKIRVWAYGSIASSQINLKNMSDSQLGTLDGTNPDLTTIEKKETDSTYTVGVQFEMQDFGTTCMAYNYYVNDYANDKAYYITVNGCGKYSDYDFLYNLAHSVEVVELN